MCLASGSLPEFHCAERPQCQNTSTIWPASAKSSYANISTHNLMACLFEPASPLATLSYEYARYLRYWRQNNAAVSTTSPPSHEQPPTEWAPLGLLNLVFIQRCQMTYRSSGRWQPISDCLDTYL